MFTLKYPLEWSTSQVNYPVTTVKPMGARSAITVETNRGNDQVELSDDCGVVWLWLIDSPTMEEHWNRMGECRAQV